MRGKAIALGSGIVLLLVAGIIGWNLVAVPRRADHLYRQTVELFLEVDIILREGIPSLWRDADSEKIRTTCASLTVAPLSSMGDSVAQLDGLRYTLKGAGKQELAGKFVDAAKRYWRAQKGAIDSWCNNNGLFLVRVRHARESLNANGSMLQPSSIESWIRRRSTEKTWFQCGKRWMYCWHGNEWHFCQHRHRPKVAIHMSVEVHCDADA